MDFLNIICNRKSGVSWLNCSFPEISVDPTNQTLSVPLEEDLFAFLLPVTRCFLYFQDPALSSQT